MVLLINVTMLCSRRKTYLSLSFFAVGTISTTLICHAVKGGGRLKLTSFFIWTFAFLDLLP
jgi:hypothetical protein